MADDDAQDPSDRTGGGEARPQDPIVGRLRPDPAQPPEPALTLSGFLGDSDREGYRRLYFSEDLDYYAEFRADDILAADEIATEQQPFAGEQATRVTLRRSATVDYTRSHTARPVDEFDIDVRLGGRLAAPFRRPQFITANTCDDACPVTPGTCADTCQTCGTNCGTCFTDCPTCGEATCANTCATCQTCGRATCGQATCQDTCQTCATACEATCFGTCGEQTCQTCVTCGGETCQTCGTCGEATCVTCGEATCGQTCVTCGEVTCVTCGEATCEQTCGTCQTCATCGEGTCVTCSETCQRTCGPTCMTCATCDRDTCNFFTCEGPRCFVGPR